MRSTYGKISIKVEFVTQITADTNRRISIIFRKSFKFIKQFQFFLKKGSIRSKNMV